MNKAIENVPDEWVKKTKEELEKEYKTESQRDFKEINVRYINRKEFALKAVKKKHLAILFKMLFNINFFKNCYTRFTFEF